MASTRRGRIYIPCIKQRFEVDFITGVITSKRTGKAMTGTDSYGYIQCHIGFINGKRKMMKGHQIVYLLYHGELPKETIDHFDRVKIHNGISNLRPATYQEQARNKDSLGMAMRGKFYRPTIRDGEGRQFEKHFLLYSDAVAWKKRKEKELWV